ncbi:MAG TPA: deoxyribonucleoside 5'-monophosphate N-glycosidase [Bacteroidetes bacterium]|nr:deoxyribonucleoside 5'-monophosphate N-glycosidase [Bacteroidota bacterium]
MKIYFAAAISAGRDYAPVYEMIVNTLRDADHLILTEHVADQNVLELEKNIPAKKVFERDLRKLKEAELLVAEVSHPSTGVGYEIATMLSMKKPVLCLYLRGLNMSKMITGNTESGISLYAYESVDELLNALPELIPDHKL